MRDFMFDNVFTGIEKVLSIRGVNLRYEWNSCDPSITVYEGTIRCVWCTLGRDAAPSRPLDPDRPCSRMLPICVQRDFTLPWSLVHIALAERDMHSSVRASGLSCYCRLNELEVYLRIAWNSCIESFILISFDCCYVIQYSWCIFCFN